MERDASSQRNSSSHTANQLPNCAQETPTVAGVPGVDLPIDHPGHENDAVVYFGCDVRLKARVFVSFLFAFCGRLPAFPPVRY